MSGVCPTVPERTRVTYDDTPPDRATFRLETIPNVLFNTCGGANNQDITNPPITGGETVIVNTQCCPAPGPVGPTGNTGPQGDPGLNGLNGLGITWAGVWQTGTSYNVADQIDTETDIVLSSDGNTYICILDHTADASSEPGVGGSWATYWDLFVQSGTGGTTFRGEWAEGISYSENDFVYHNGYLYAAQVTHTSTSGDEPDPEFDVAPGGGTWFLAADLTPEQQKSFVEGLADGVWDWLTDIPNWGVGDYVTAIVAGAGLVWVGNELNDMFELDPVGDGNANSIYTGDPTYAGAFNAPTLVDTVEKLCEYAGITSYDTSALNPTTRVNFTVGQTTSVRQVIETLALTYGFSMIDSGGTIKFVPYYNNNAATSLTVVQDLGFKPRGNSLSAPYSVKRLQGVDVPSSIEFTYFSAASAHNNFVQTVPPDNSFTQGQKVKISVPVTLDDTEAYGIAERIFVTSHLERTTYTFNTSYKYIHLEPGDFIDLDEVGELRIIRIDEQSPGILTFTCTDVGPDRDSINQSSTLNAATPPTYTDTTPYIGYSAGIAVELPPLDASDTEPRLTLAPHGFGAEGWSGCTVFVSGDGGNTYSPFSNATTQATWGRVAISTTGVTDPHIWDETTTISVELKTGTLSNKTELEVLNGDNWALIGDEIIGFKNAAFVSGTTYTLSGLLRGRRGTDYYAINSLHQPDELFLLLNTALIEFPYSLNDKSKVFQFKYVTTGSDISKAVAYQAQPNMKSRRPWMPANVQGTQSGNDWNVTWLARNQFNGEMVDSATVNKPEDFAGYVFEILNVSDIVVRSVVQQGNTFNYTEALQVQDFGSVQTQIKVRITQIDLKAGPGYYTVHTFGA